MSNIANDKSTDIEKLVKAFANDMTAWAAELHKRQLKQYERDMAAQNEAMKSSMRGRSQCLNVTAPPLITFEMSKQKDSKSRTPAEQAKLLVKGSTKVCWSAHMADKARHVIMKVDGKPTWNPQAYFDDFPEFTKKWGETMKKHGLKNAAGKDGWPTWDEFHLELPEGKIGHEDERSEACLDEYARLTRVDGEKKNKNFETKYAKLLKSFIEKYQSEAAGK